MAQFEIIEQEGVRLIKATLQNETIRTEAGALYYMRGDLTMESKAPGVGGFLKSLASGEKIFRPTYTGTGELFLEPTFGGYHIYECGGETWIAENGAYWASEMGVEVSVHREKALTALKSGEGFLDFQTKLSGHGQIVLQAQGPVETVTLRDERMVVDGRYVLARSGSIHYSASRATKSLFASFTSGEGLVRNYEGTGTLLMAPIPYWRHRLFDSIAALTAARTAKSS
ncbi:MAG: AIM24 family protein [Verrucomicrobiales bacterium]|nr:AIM24 family protein [Verrucomicrobiales bacterium]MCP5527462.1 AIM24 family protein [Verrucomicrobiales bacterium]